jgi:hypothetical protein
MTPPRSGNAPSLNPPGAVVTHYDDGPHAGWLETPLCGFTDRADGYTRDWSRVNCRDCHAANETGTPQGGTS